MSKTDDLLEFSLPSGGRVSLSVLDALKLEGYKKGEHKSRGLCTSSFVCLFVLVVYMF